MPYAIEKRNGKFCVVNQNTGASVSGGCHPTRPKAVAHMRALYANVPDASGESEMNIEHKSYPITQLKTDDEKGIIEAYVSVFNNVDSGKEIVRPGFFTKSIQKKLPKGVWMHDWKQPIAKTLEAKELPPGDVSLPPDLQDLGATYIKGQFNLGTQRGREAYSDLKFGIVDEFSIGYKVTKESKDEKTGARELLEGDWKEWSPVLVGMNDQTRLLSLKSEEGLDEKAQWTSAYINNLPDSAFAYIEPGGEKDDEGKTKPRSLRHFPYKDANGSLDEAHIRNALARIPQSKLSQAAKDSALAKIEAAAKKVGIDVSKQDSAIENKALFEDVLEEREEGLYFLFDVLCTAIYRAQMLDEMSEDEGDGSFDLAAAMDEILSEFSARVKDAIAGPEEEAEEDQDSGDEMMASREPISFKGDLRAGSTFAKNTKAVLATLEVFAQRGAALAEFVEEFKERSAAIMETRFKDGRMYSANNLSQMQRVHGAMGKVKKDVAAIHADMGTLIQRAQKPEKSDAESLRTQSLKARSLALAALT